MKTVTWTTKKGNKMEATIEGVKRTGHYNDSYGKEIECKPTYSTIVKVSMNGENVAEGTPYESPEVKEFGAFAAIGRLPISEDICNEIIEAMEAENMDPEKEAKAEAIRQAEIKKATEIINEAAEATHEILSEVEEAKWRTNYNNMMNEGGYGYVPERITLESIAWAKEVLA